jgi:hypothetical protein
MSKPLLCAMTITAWSTKAVTAASSILWPAKARRQVIRRRVRWTMVDRAQQRVAMTSVPA